MEWKNYIVGLVDISGQSSKLDELGSLWWELQDTGNTTEEKSEIMDKLTKETYEEVEHFRILFTDSFNSMKKNFLKHPRIDTLSPSEQAVVTKITNEMFKLRSFSDLVVFYTPFDAIDELLNRVRISSMLVAYTCVLILEFSVGTFFRGGIEIGAGAELGNGDLYGPVLNEVYRLESKIADYPRLIIGKRLSTFIQSQSQNLDKGEFLNGVLKRANDFCKKMIYRDNDGQIILDYLGEEAFKLNQFSGSKGCSFVKESITKIEDSLNNHKKDGNEKLERLYEKLLKYYQSRIKIWDN
jgi:hypothetical protein